MVKFEFIRMPDSTGFGDYTESGQVIPVKFNGVAGGYSHSMYLNDDAPIAGGREIWGFPKKLVSPSLEVVLGFHIVADLTLGMGRVVHDYLKD